MSLHVFDLAWPLRLLSEAETTPALSPAAAEQATRMYLADESVTRIAETLRVSRATIYYWHIAGLTETAAEHEQAKVDPSPKRQRG